MAQVNDRIMYESKLRHHLESEEECNKGHISPSDPGQCRWCYLCIQWIRPKDFDGDCNPCSHREDNPDDE